MKKTASIGTDFTTGDITKHLLNFLTPFLLASILNSLYNTVDMIMIGSYVGSTGTVAVSLGGKMMNMFTFVGTGLASGGQIMIAQQMGARQSDQIKTTVGTLFSMLGILSASVGILCVIFARPILLWLNTPPESLQPAIDYFIITSLGMPLLFGYSSVSSVLRGMGDSKNPLLFIAIATVTNIVLDAIFIIPFNMGAAGAALATVISQGVAFVTAVVLLYKRKEELGFDFKPKSFLINKSKAKVILQIGLPMAARSVFIQATQLYIMRYVNVMGLVQAAAYGIGDKIIHLSNVVTQSTNQAGGSMVAQNIGRGYPERAKQTVNAALKVTVTFSAILAILSIIFPNMMFSLFTKDEAVLAYSRDFMLIAALTYFLSAISGAYGAMVTGTGNSSLAFLAGFLDGVVFRIAFSFLLGYTFNMGVTGFFLGNTLARLAPLMVNSAYYFSGAWMRRKKLVELEE